MCPVRVRKHSSEHFSALQPPQNLFLLRLEFRLRDQVLVQHRLERAQGCERIRVALSRSLSHVSFTRRLHGSGPSAMSIHCNLLQTELQIVSQIRRNQHA